MKTYDEFDSKYNPILNENTGTYYFETNGKDFEKVKDTPFNRVWTVVDVNDKLTIISGLHFVNRFLYIITKEPVHLEDISEEFEYE